MEEQTDICRAILNEFLERWTVERLQRMTLEEYVSVGDRDTFCQWIETRTRELGSIKGISSIKFGIYKRSDTKKKPSNFINDDQYSWRRTYHTTKRKIAFRIIKTEILKTIKYAQFGQFEKIDGINLVSFVKWKIAFLFSNERLIPIFSRGVLIKIAKHFGANANNKTPRSTFQRLMIENKPAHLSIYEYSVHLYEMFGGIASGRAKKKKLRTRRTKRRAASGKNTGEQIRSGTETHIAKQIHNELQLALEEKLIGKYGKKCVFLEEDYIDIKVVLPQKVYYYEVKSAAYAGDCIKQALGQILSYSHREGNHIPLELVVAGQNKPNKDEKKFINYIQRNLKLNFSYEHIDISER